MNGIKLILLSLCLLGVTFAYSQRTVSGTVISGEDNLGIPGASVIVKGSSPLIGTASDFDGHYSLSVPEGAILVFSSTGMQSKEVEVGGQSTIDVVLSSSATTLDAVVVIGYGTMTKEKLTGSVASIEQKDLNKGVITNATGLIAGKVAGVNITPSSGRAGDGNRIRIRGGASLNASNDPLIVIDGLPISNDQISGQTNPLSSLNPNDIESMTILKDASATAIYGSRASNGVIIITTKKGADKKINIEFSSTNSLATVARRVEVLTGDEIKKLVENYTGYTSLAEKARYIGYLGYTENGVKKYANTDWQKEIYRPAFSSDNNFSISGKVPHLPYRVSVGYLTQDGLLKTDNMQRVSGAVSLNPTFFKGDLLNINVNLKGSWTKSHFGDGGAIGSALRFDPTKPVHTTDNDAFNGYWQWKKGDGSWNSMATTNPLSQLYSKHDIGTVGRAFGNIQIDYKFHFLPDLRVNVNLGFDYANGKGYNAIEAWNPGVSTKGGEYNQYNTTRFDKLIEAYLAYSKDFGKNHFDIMAGYTYQSWLSKGPNFPQLNYAQTDTLTKPDFENWKEEHVLISFYGRANYSWADKYLVQASIRTDGSSRFAKEHRWGWFPAVSAAWRINKENFLVNNQAVSNLKLRLGWGMTGQQEIGNYEYLSRYSMSTNTAMVQFGDQFYYMWRPAGYDSERRWEATTTYNVGIDYGFLKGKIYGALDLYYKYTTDLLNEVPLPLGSNFTNRIVKNIGAMANKGVEFSINYIPVNTKDWNVDLGLNVTVNNTKIKKLSLNDGDSTYVGALVGGVSGGTGNYVQIHTVGYNPYSFYVYEQEYDANGKLIEGQYKDQNGDGVINESDLRHYHSPEPVAFIGLNANISWKNLTLSTSLRSSLGNYLYNNVSSDVSNYSQILNPNNFISNGTTDIYNSGITGRELLSDYFVQNASFLKMDYISLGYDFGELVKPCRLSLNFTVQNVFTITKYKGIDPEIASGIDGNVYPYPRTFSLGLKLQY